MCRLSRTVAVAIFLGIHALHAAAAPTTSESAEVSNDESAAAAARTLRDAPGHSAGDQTLDRLIQLQSRTAGIEFKERQRPVAPSLRNGTMAGTIPPFKPATATAPPPQTTHGMFGSGAVPQQQTAATTETSAVEPPWKQREMANTPGAAGTGGGDAPSARVLLIPRELILFIRENRGWVLGGSLSALALCWAASMAFARRRSRAHA
jgi:hypothetical protein